VSVWIGVDVGGTKVLAGAVDADGRVTSTVERATPGRLGPVEELEDVLTEAVGEAAGGRPVAGVGLAAAGFVDRTGDRVAFAPHLPWRDAPVRERLSERWQGPVALENDATCAMVAEVELGAARGTSSSVLVTVGTGIGGGLALDGRAVRGAQGMAGEYGHMTLVPDGRDCECGGVGCWEQYCSGRALVRAARSGLADAAEPSVLAEWCPDPSRVTGPLVTRAAGAGDPVACAAFAEVGTWLGRGLVNLVAALDPERVVVGGGVSRAGDLLLEPARRTLAEHLVGAGHREVPEVVPARFGPWAGLVGAAVLVRRLQSGSDGASSTS